MNHVFAPGRDRRRTVVGRGLIVLRIHDHTVTEITGSHDAIACAGNQRSVRWIEKFRIKSRESAISIIRRSEIRMAHTIVAGEVIPYSHLVVDMGKTSSLCEIR